MYRLGLESFHTRSPSCSLTNFEQKPRNLQAHPNADPNSVLCQAEGVMLDFYKGFLDERL